VFNNFIFIVFFTLAHMGISEGKQIGEWLGPNTMSQVLKKLVVFDNWSQIVVHVALNNVIFII
jgi:cysteine protease ATG4